MRYASIFAALVLAVSVSACATAATQQEDFTRTDADAIRKASIDLAAAFNEKQIDTVLEFYAENSVFMPPNAPQLRGRDPLKSFFGELLAKGAANLRLEPEEVAGHGPIAYEYGTYSVDLGANRRDRGKYVRLLRNTAGTWRVEKTIWSSDLPPAAAAAQTN
jgi:ketosteroid isomerase-like protein